MKIDRRTLFSNYLVVDRFGFDIKYCLLPRRVKQKDIAGTYISSSRTFDIDSPCIFLEKKIKKCSIHKVKPKGCAEMNCWEEATGKNNHVSISNLKKLGWDMDMEDY